jgi:serine protease Do
MIRYFVLYTAFLFIIPASAFTQAGVLRDYVGLINQTFHPGAVSYLEKFRGEFERRGNRDAVRGLDAYLKGGSGSGFIYVAEDGANYVITNYHVITQAYDISITFEKPDGTRTKYQDLNIVAADEDMDIALLVFPRGGDPFDKGLAFLDRPVNEGEDVYSAGFPGLGGTPLWQFGRGMVSNANVRFPADDDSRIMGPYIQHTAQVDPGNSGGPLLVPIEGVPAGYAVAGINTLSARYRQAANFSIPMNRVRSFLEAALNPMPVDERPRLEARINSFIQGLDAPKTVYEHIAKYLSNACTAENAEYALNETMNKASRTVQNAIIEAFIYSPVEGMNYAVAWTIENSLRSRSGNISLALDTVTPNNKNGFTVTFKVNNGAISSEWINEYGIWRIGSFGDFAAGDKTFAERRENERREAEKLKTDYDFQMSSGFAYLVDQGPAFGSDLKKRTWYFDYGLRTYIAKDKFIEIELFAGIYYPIRLKRIGITLFGDAGIGFRMIDTDNLGPCIPIQAGLMFASPLFPGLYLQSAYQYNRYFTSSDNPNPNALFISIGFGF